MRRYTIIDYQGPFSTAKTLDDKNVKELSVSKNEMNSAPNIVNINGVSQNFGLKCDANTERTLLNDLISEIKSEKKFA